MLKDRVAIITGAAKRTGIGYYVAREFAAEGASVTVVDLDDPSDTVAEINESGRLALGLNVDVTDASDVSEMVSRTLETFGRIDVLVNNVDLSPAVHLLDFSEELWDMTHNATLKAVFLSSRAVVRAMVDGRHAGKIINIPADCILCPPEARRSPGESEVHALTRRMARDLLPYCINVNAISPGEVRPEEAPGPEEETFPQLNHEDQVEARVVCPDLPHGKRRTPTPRDIARVAVFLASEDSNPITGEVIRVNGFPTHEPL